MILELGDLYVLCSDLMSEDGARVTVDCSFAPVGETCAVIQTEIDLEVSVGDYVLSGGELPAMTLIDAVSRLVPGVLGKQESAEQHSFTDGLLDCPHYTRPEVLDGLTVPEVLLSGNHREIASWRRQRSLELTARRRPDLIAALRSDGRLSAADEQFLATLGL